MLAHPAKLNLALQGGGAHGAYTWGVLDALLEDGRFAFEGLSGSSAGAMNAVVCAQGWQRGGRDGARQALADFWNELGQLMPWGLFTRRSGDVISLTPASRMLAHWAGQFTPAQLNPFDLNPLRDMLRRQLDFERLRQDSPFKLFIGATRVRTGQLRVFREHELDVDVLLASACLPKIHHTVAIDGEPYWDGGYSANPAVFPLVQQCGARDILLVLLHPLRRAATPRTQPEIEARVADLTFQSHFLREMHGYAAPQGGGWRALRAPRFHLVGGEELPALARQDSKLIAHAPFLQQLQAQGRSHAQAWLRERAPGVGRRSTIDVAALFG